MAGASAGLAYLAELSGNDVLARRAWGVSLGGHRGEPAAADLRPRRADALPEHAADVQGHVADERRLVDPRGAAGPRRGSRRRTRSPACFGGLARVARPVAGAARAAARDVHRRADRQHRGAGLARGAPRRCRCCSRAAPRRAPARRRRSLTPVRARRAGAPAGGHRRRRPSSAVASAMERRLGELAEPYHQGTPRTLARASAGLTAIGRPRPRALGPAPPFGRGARRRRAARAAPPRSASRSSTRGSRRRRTRSTPWAPARARGRAARRRRSAIRRLLTFGCGLSGQTLLSGVTLLPVHAQIRHRPPAPRRAGLRDAHVARARRREVDRSSAARCRRPMPAASRSSRRCSSRACRRAGSPPRSTPVSSTTRRIVCVEPRSTCSHWPGVCAAPEVQRVVASSSTSVARRRSGVLAVALMSSASSSWWLSSIAGHVNVASAPPGSVYVNDWPPCATVNVRGSSFSLCATSAIEPSGLRNAASMIWPFQPVVPNDVEAIRCAPGRTNRARWPSV